MILHLPALIVSDRGENRADSVRIVLGLHAGERARSVAEIGVSPGASSGQAHRAALTGNAVGVGDRARDGIGRTAHAVVAVLVGEGGRAPVIGYTLRPAVCPIAVADCLRRGGARPGEGGACRLAERSVG